MRNFGSSASRNASVNSENAVTNVAMKIVAAASCHQCPAPARPVLRTASCPTTPVDRDAETQERQNHFGLDEPHDIEASAPARRD